MSQAHSAGLDVIIAEEHSQLSPTKILASANSRVLTKSLLDLSLARPHELRIKAVCASATDNARKLGLAWLPSQIAPVGQRSALG